MQLMVSDSSFCFLFVCFQGDGISFLAEYVPGLGLVRLYRLSRSVSGRYYYYRAACQKLLNASNSQSPWLPVKCV